MTVAAVGPTVGMPARVLMIGNFDGVHRGHQQLITSTLRQARILSTIQARPCALTFSPHPRRFFQGDAAPPMLTDDEERARLLATYGIEETIVLPFDAPLSGLSADEFSWDILKTRLGAVHVVVGAGYRFGRSREGGVEDLHRLAGLHGYGLTVVDLAAGADRQAFSSTRVRNALADGDLLTAMAILGRPWSRRVVIITEQGRAKIASGARLPLPAGVYQVAVRIMDGDAAMQITTAHVDDDGGAVLDWSVPDAPVTVELQWLDRAPCGALKRGRRYG